MDYNECCRSCIQPISDKVNLLTDKKILNLFEECTKLKINKEDALPKYLCSICYSKCSKWKEFQEECKQNEKFLIDWCSKESKTAVKTEIVFLDLGIKEESDSDDNGFDLMPENDDNSCNESESEDAKLKSMILNTICEVKLEDIGKGRAIATRSRGVINNHNIDIVKEASPELQTKPKQIDRRRLNPKSILAPKKIIVKKLTNLSKLNVCDNFNYVERIDGVSDPVIPRTMKLDSQKKNPDVPITDFKTENESEPVSSETNGLTSKANTDNETSQLVNTETSQLVNTETLQLVNTETENIQKQKLLEARKSTKRAYCEESDNDEEADDGDEFMKNKKNPPAAVYKCWLCRGLFKRLEVYELHFLCVHLKKEPFECTICYAKYARSEKLEFHLLKNHIPTILTPKVFCGVCAKGFENELELKKHSKNHVIHRCDHCEQVFTNRRNLLSHVYRRHSQKEKVILKCDDCERTFLHKASLTAHVKQDHLKEFSFICNICGKLFATNSKLLSHLKTHNEERPHVCHICSNAYKKKEKLKFHMTIHTGEKPFKCPHCDRTFRHNTVMKHHAMTHTGERPHVCPICNRGFIQKIALTKHMNSHE